DIGDKMNVELRAQSANLVVTPVEDSLDVNLGGVNLKPASAGAFIRESELTHIKGIFWGHNVLGYAPFLSAQQNVKAGNRTLAVELIGTYFVQPLKYGTESFVTGVRSVNKFWKVDGNWPADDSSDALIGRSLAQEADLHPGQPIEISSQKL